MYAGSFRCSNERCSMASSPHPTTLTARRAATTAARWVPCRSPPARPSTAPGELFPRGFLHHFSQSSEQDQSCAHALTLQVRAAHGGSLHDAVPVLPELPVSVQRQGLLRLAAGRAEASPEDADRSRGDVRCAGGARAGRRWVRAHAAGLHGRPAQDLRRQQAAAHRRRGADRLWPHR
jgi:hypothetical protein